MWQCPREWTSGSSSFGMGRRSTRNRSLGSISVQHAVLRVTSCPRWLLIFTVIVRPLASLLFLCKLDRVSHCALLQHFSPTRAFRIACRHRGAVFLTLF